jgi:hypothetical protein
MEIGNYTVLHDYFLDLTDAERQQEFATEVAAAQQTFVANMGVAPTACEPVRPAPLSHGGRYATVDGFIRKARMRALPVVGIDPVSSVLSGTDPLTWHFLTEI